MRGVITSFFKNLQIFFKERLWVYAKETLGRARKEWERGVFRKKKGGTAFCRKRDTTRNIRFHVQRIDNFVFKEKAGGFLEKKTKDFGERRVTITAGTEWPVRDFSWGRKEGSFLENAERVKPADGDFAVNWDI